MTKEELIEKYGLTPLENSITGSLFFSMLDNLYVCLTREQAVEFIKDFYDNADEIFNQIAREIDEGIKNLRSLFAVDEEPKDPRDIN